MAQTFEQPKTNGAPRRQLPPLILHPFTDQAGTAQFIEQSKASLMLSGLLPNGGYTREELAGQVLRARFLEIRMLYFLGKDLFRWIGQCVESMGSEGIREQSFADYLTRSTPLPVREKLRGWGVLDFPAIFTRALGLYTAFGEPPAFEWLSHEFILNYHRYADHLYGCFQQLRSFTEIPPDRFDFEVYGSGEYSRMLESQWGTG